MSTTSPSLLPLLLLLLPLVAGQAESSLEMVSLGGRQYFFSASNLKLNWTSAQLFCRSRGLQLASLEERAENERVKEYLVDNHLIPAAEGGFWLGGEERGSGTLVWSASNRSVIFAEWRAHEPNSGGGLLACVSLWPPVGGGRPGWGMTACAAQRKFVCEQHP